MADVTCQTDLGISDHEEMLLPCKAICTLLLDKIQDVVSQALDSDATTISADELEQALKLNLDSLMWFNKKQRIEEEKKEVTEDKPSTEETTPEEEVKVDETPQKEETLLKMDPSVLRSLQQNAMSPTMFSPQQQNPLLRLIELNSELNINKVPPYKPIPFSPSGHFPQLPHLQNLQHLQKLQSFSNLINKPQFGHNLGLNPLQTSQLQSLQSNPLQSLQSNPLQNLQPNLLHSSPLQKPSSPPLQQKTSPLQFHSPRVFTPGTIKTESVDAISPTRSTNNAFPISSQFSYTPTFTPPTSMAFTPPKSMTSMEIHQNFIKQMNLLNSAAPSMLNQKLATMTSEDPKIEKVLMDIQANLANIKQDPWNLTKDKLYKCPHCDTSFARRQYLSNHIINVHNLKTCPECKTTFSNEDAFNAHLALHPKKEYECGSCNKSFNSVYLLKNHRKTHVKDKPFACNICGKTFADKYYLRNHFSIHSPVKPYTCAVCGRGFASSSALRYHSFQHTGEKPAKCQYCPSEFVQKNQLKLHIARKHKDLINSINSPHAHLEGDIMTGTVSLKSSPTSSPAHTSPTHLKSSPLSTIVHSPQQSGYIANLNSMNSLAKSPIAQDVPSVVQSSVHMVQSVTETAEEPMQVDSEPATTATTQLEELIASLQREKQPSTDSVDNTTDTNAIQSGVYNNANFAFSSPFSKITDGINQILEGTSPLAVNETG